MAAEKDKPPTKEMCAKIYCDTKLSNLGFRCQTRPCEGWTVNILWPTEPNRKEFEQSGHRFKTYMPFIAQFPKVDYFYHRRPYLLHAPDYLLDAFKVSRNPSVANQSLFMTYFSKLLIYQESLFILFLASSHMGLDMPR